jgi:HEAT repeat protein
VRSLADTNANSKDYVIQALAAVDPMGEVVAPPLRCQAQEPSASVRIHAAAALVALQDPAGPQMLAREMESPDEQVRVAGVQQLRDYSGRGRGAVPLLVARLRSDPSTRVRVECARTLPWLDPSSEEVLNALETAAHDAQAEVRVAAASSLRDLPSLRSRQ